jgi:hypothetical protein
VRPCPRRPGTFWIIGTLRLMRMGAFFKITSFDFGTAAALGSLLAGATQVTQCSAFIQTIYGSAVFAGLSASTLQHF